MAAFPTTSCAQIGMAISGKLTELRLNAKPKKTEEKAQLTKAETAPDHD